MKRIQLSATVRLTKQIKTDVLCVTTLCVSFLTHDVRVNTFHHLVQWQKMLNWAPGEI